ncbi:glutamine-hydrolyzing carbamoyl-phosphate synthase small subunit [Ilyobacter polytropus]|uniref:Carbamoyl phosphate synthase small chain n=1 Tax=Ilyobacter polytropus (strain ATCC 51220 / DSM 2926 / LMG 16218 / CuHBu1) TaxID=572544 RepID=E3HC22_ILYPC|nr:glutamine-hydrolyzing carbamoyl-phosphate synthase small subunit [Ilyobacter polytropus]ADO84348.1 carbamoyl-phosphate synthase small subunit [Ilyobacter polytropus DSM 2926]
MYGALYLEDGTVYEGKGFGYEGVSSGELVFNTSMTGYQEILTDPSYAGQVITMTYPLIGNYGVNETFNEADKSYAKGMVVKAVSENPSNFMSEGDFDKFLKKMKIVGVYGVDTRAVTKKIRDNGAMKCVISSRKLTQSEIDEHMGTIKTEDDWMRVVGTQKAYKVPGDGFRVALIDFGVKENIIRNLQKRGCHVTVYPFNATSEEVMAGNPDGVLLSNGPGDPKFAVEGIEAAKDFIGKIPMFGICLGHQVISLAIGGDTYKTKFGHRGGNHGVLDIDRNKSFISSQNHGYATEEKSLAGTGARVNFINLNDNTVEGIEMENYPVFSVQFHPEGAPGPEDTTYLFDKFIKFMKESKNEA